jgi:hypothetical protein
MALTVSSFYPGIAALLQGRPAASYPSPPGVYIRKVILELTEDYKFPGLQTTGPVVQFIPYQAVYAPSFFLATADAALEVNKVDSFFIYNYPYAGITSNQSNSGYNLRFATIDTIEVLINTPGLPQKWTRHEDNVWFGNCPDQSYSCYMRYQKEHPFPNAGVPDVYSGGVVVSGAGIDPVLLPNSWQDIVEYAAAGRIARDLNLQSKANELTTTLKGDAQFQSSGGISGSPGLIFGRTSQENRDQTTSVKALRLRMGVQR